MSTQSIITYRNPLEAAIWESFSQPSIVTAIVLGMVAFFSLLFLGDWVLRKKCTLRIGKKWNRLQNINLALAAICGVLVMLYIAGYA